MATGDLKIDFINGAYSRLRISGLTAQPSPEDVKLALGRLDSMASEFYGRNICTGYNLEDNPDPNSPHNVPREYWEAFELNLAIRLMPDFGKGMQPDPLLISQQQASFSFLSSSTALTKQVQYPSRQPRGSGSSLRYNRWSKFYRPQEDAPLSCETNKMFIGDVEDFVEHYDSFLGDTDDLSSYTIAVDTGLIIVSDALETPDLNYRIKAEGFGAGNNLDGFLQVKIVMTTSLGRVTSRVVNFELSEVQ